MNKKITLPLAAFPLAVSLFGICVKTNNASSVKADSEYINVSNYEELKFQISSKSEKIALNNDIVIPSDSINPGEFFFELDYNLELNGNGYVLQVEKTGFDENGYFNNNPDMCTIFCVNGCELTLENITIRGGSMSAIYINCDSYLKVLNSTIEQTGSKDNSCSGFENSGGYVYMKDSKLSRNGGDYGGGFANESGWVIMENCSLNENRSLGALGGGGGCEDNGEGILIMNNCTIANNLSTEIGGGINNYESFVTLMNCTVVGNSTNRSLDYGGGVGVNGGFLNTYNTVLTNNYYIGGNFTYQSDIGLVGWAYNPEAPENPPINSYGTKVGVIADDDGVLDLDIDGIERFVCSNGDFAKFVDTAAVPFNTWTGEFEAGEILHRPALMVNEKGTFASYLGTDSSLLEGGCDTYLYVPEDMSTWDFDTVVAGYKENGEYKAILANRSEYFATPTDETYLVNTYQDGSERISGVIGANSGKEIDSVLLTVVPGNMGAKSDFGSPFGELLPYGTKVTINPVLKDPSGDKFLYWQDQLDKSITYDIDYFKDFELTKDYIIKPVVEEEIFINNCNQKDDIYNLSGGYLVVDDTASRYDKIDIEVHSNEGLELAYLSYFDSGLEREVFYSGVDSIYAKNQDVELCAYFWNGKNPTSKTLVYSGSAMELVNAGVNGSTYYDEVLTEDDGHFEYSLTGNISDYSLSVPKGTNAGDYTVYWRYVHDADSVSGCPDRYGTVLVTIQKQLVEKPEADKTNFIANGNVLTYNIPESPAYKVTGNKASNPGKFQVTVKLNNNYVWADGTNDDLVYDFVIKQPSILNPVDDEGRAIIDPKVSIVSSEKGLDPNAVLVVKVVSVESGDEVAAVEQTLKETSKLTDDKMIYGLYEAKLILDGAEVQPDGNITIKMQVPEELWNKEFALYHIHNNGGTKEVITITPSSMDENHCVTFVTNKLSSFSFVGAKPVNPTPASNCFMHWILLGVFIVGITVCAVLFYLKMRFCSIIAAFVSLLASIVLMILGHCLLCTIFGIIDISIFAIGFGFLLYLFIKQVNSKDAKKN